MEAVLAALTTAVLVSGALLAWAQHSAKKRADERQAAIDEENARRSARQSATEQAVASLQAALARADAERERDQAARDAERLREREERDRHERACAERISRLELTVSALARQVVDLGGQPMYVPIDREDPQ